MPNRAVHQWKSGRGPGVASSPRASSSRAGEIRCPAKKPPLPGKAERPTNTTGFRSRVVDWLVGEDRADPAASPFPGRPDAGCPSPRSSGPKNSGPVASGKCITCCAPWACSRGMNEASVTHSSAARHHGPRRAESRWKGLSTHHTATGTPQARSRWKRSPQASSPCRLTLRNRAGRSSASRPGRLVCRVSGFTRRGVIPSAARAASSSGSSSEPSVPGSSTVRDREEDGPAWAVSSGCSASAGAMRTARAAPSSGPQKEGNSRSASR